MGAILQIFGVTNNNLGAHFQRLDVTNNYLGTHFQRYGANNNYLDVHFRTFGATTRKSEVIKCGTGEIGFVVAPNYRTKFAPNFMSHPKLVWYENVPNH